MPPIRGTPISSDLVSTSFDNDGNREPILDVQLLHNEDSGARISSSLISEALNRGSVVFPGTNGSLPDASLSENQGRVAVDGNHVLISRDFGDHIKSVTFKDYGPDRVVDTGEPAITAQEMTFIGSFENLPPSGGTYSVNDLAWDRSAGLFLIYNGSNWPTLPSSLNSRLALVMVMYTLILTKRKNT